MTGIRALCYSAFCALGIAAFLTAGEARPSFAQSGTDFRGKTISLGVPSSTGGAYDSYVRLLARYYQKTLPGNPNTVSQNVPGGGGLVLANRLYNLDPKDGTHIAMIRASVLYEGVFGNPAAKFDGRKFVWIGNFNSDRDTCIFWHTAGIQNPADFYDKEVVLGASGAGGMSYTFPAVYNSVLGTRFKIIRGYRGVGDRVLAMQRGELQGGCGLTTTAFKVTIGQPYKEGKLKIVALSAPDPNFPDVPNMLDQAKNPEQRQALEFLFAQMEIGRAMAAPPGTPEAIAEILQRGFEAAIADEEFLAEAAALKLDISPMNGARTAMVVERFYATPDAVIQKVRGSLEPQAQ